MANETDRELLCFSSDGAVFAVDFSDIAEICIHVRLQFVPRQPDYFSGVFYYKGSIVPVAAIGHTTRETDDKNAAVLVVNGVPDLYGILLTGSPWMERVKECDLAKDHSGAVIPGRWVSKAIYCKGDQMICLLDIRRSQETLAAGM
ncbi:MAG: chemotaxis protein CheW [Clostridiaceae bacterium]|nr:chemotaxis protein CheW [Clostridiaceae bacterium]